MSFNTIINSIKEFFKKLFGQSTKTTTTPTTTSTTSTPLPTTDTTTTLDPFYGGKFVAGDSRDKGTEIHTFWNEIDVRCLANDVEGAIGKDYFMSDVINRTGALSLLGKMALGKNFVSPLSNKKYRFMGFKKEKSANPLITTNPLTLTSFSGTFRAYWNSVE